MRMSGDSIRRRNVVVFFMALSVLLAAGQTCYLVVEKMRAGISFASDFNHKYIEFGKSDSMMIGKNNFAKHL
jgi:hypothetical protein